MAFKHLVFAITNVMLYHHFYYVGRAIQLQTYTGAIYFNDVSGINTDTTIV